MECVKILKDCFSISTLKRNLGTSKRYKVKDVAEKIFEIMGWRPNKIIFDTSKPIGVISRALDISRAKRLLGWEAEVHPRGRPKKDYRLVC